MAGYFNGSSEIQGGGDGLQTLILMNPGYVGGYSGNQQAVQGNSFVYFNSNSGQGMAHAPPPQSQHFVGIPLQGAAASEDVSGNHGMYSQRFPYNVYNLPIDTAARDLTRSQQGLSLSLSSQQPLGFGGFRPPERDVQSLPIASPNRGRTHEVRVPGGSSPPASAVSNGIVFSSKYLKAVQELLSEVVNVGKTPRAQAGSSKPAADSSSSAAAATTDVADGFSEAIGKDTVTELSNSERQEILTKRAKFMHMLDEVDQRYLQYHHHMQSITAWFEQTAGTGSSKIYTSLALQTISKQFRCLKDALLAEVRSANRALGEDEDVDGKTEGSRIKFIDNQIRQQRALSQLGMIHQNAWRPQRGLPERSVSVLRAWLFEHFLHPYPKDSDKVMLAKKTGLTRSQVSNWFINARVRLWKPMVEEMYMEEMKENAAEDKAGNSDTSSEKKIAHNDTQQCIAEESPSKKSRKNDGVLHSLASDKIAYESNREGFSLIGPPANFIGGFRSYSIGELGQYTTEQFPATYPGNGVSLTLGLPDSHCDSLAMQGTQQRFMPNQSIPLGRGVDIGNGDAFSGLNGGPAGNVYENINIHGRKTFSEQLLPDFVASL